MDITPLIESIARRVVEQLRAGQPEADREAVAANIRSQIDPLRPYSMSEAAGFLGLKTSAVYEIPEAMLPRVRNGKQRVLGINLILYAMGQPPVDTEALARSVRERFIEQADVPRPVRRVAGAASRQRIY